MSSDRIAHDAGILQQMAQQQEVAGSADQLPAQSHAVQPCIVLRKHARLAAGREFRCFIRHSALVAISQRDVTQHSPDICADEGIIKEAICTFMAAAAFQQLPLSHCASLPLSASCCCHAHCMRSAQWEPVIPQLCMAVAKNVPAFISGARCKSSQVHAGAADVYVSAKLRVWLLDVNPAGWTTQHLLFAPEELDSLASAALQRQRGLVAALPASDEHRSRARESAANGCYHHTPQLQLQSDSVHAAQEGCHAARDQQACHRHPEQVEMRLVRSAEHIQAGGAAVFGAPADIHMSLQGVSWTDVMSLLQQESVGAQA